VHVRRGVQDKGASEGVDVKVVGGKKGRLVDPIGPERTNVGILKGLVEQSDGGNILPRERDAGM
jgi:hypothetical protein